MCVHTCTHGDQRAICQTQFFLHVSQRWISACQAWLQAFTYWAITPAPTSTPNQSQVWRLTKTAWISARGILWNIDFSFKISSQFLKSPLQQNKRGRKQKLHTTASNSLSLGPNLTRQLLGLLTSHGSYVTVPSLGLFHSSAGTATSSHQWGKEGLPPSAAGMILCSAFITSVEVPNHDSLLLQVSLLLFALPFLRWRRHQDGIYTFSINQFTALPSKRGAEEQRSTFRYKRCLKMSSCFAQFVLHTFSVSWNSTKTVAYYSCVIIKVQ